MDIEERNRIVEQNMGLVYSVARRYLNRGLDLDDLVQHGSMGFLHGLGKFDPAKGFRMSTYVVHWIRQAITRAIADESRTIRLPVHCSEMKMHLDAYRREINASATVEEMARFVGKDVETLRSVLFSLKPTLSIEHKLSNGEDSGTLLELIPSDAIAPTDQVHQQIDDAVLWALVSTLPEKMADILRLRFEEGRTLEDVGVEYGVTRERIRQIQVKAIGLLRSLLDRWKEGQMTPDEIKALRRRLGLGQRGLAETIGVSGPSISLWETGKTRPSAPNCAKLDVLAGTASDIENPVRGLDAEPQPKSTAPRIEPEPDPDGDVTIKIRPRSKSVTITASTQELAVFLGQALAVAADELMQRGRLR